MSKEKVYSVTFMEYTNCMMDTVSDAPDNSWSSIKDCNYLSVGKDPFLVKESELPKYQKYGKGYRDIKFVGFIEV